MEAIKKFLRYTILPFFSSASPGSIGRILLFVTYSVMMGRFWALGVNPPDSMVNVFYAFVAYIFGTKMVEWRQSSTGSKPLTLSPAVATDAVVQAAETAATGVAAPASVSAPAPAPVTAQAPAEVPADEVG